MTDKVIDEVKGYIQSGKTRKALDLLIEVNKDDVDKIHSLILLSGRLAASHRQVSSGVITYSEHQRNINQIVQAMMYEMELKFDLPVNKYVLPEDVFLKTLKDLITNLLIENPNYKGSYYFDGEGKHTLLKDTKDRAEYILKRIDEMAHLLKSD